MITTRIEYDREAKEYNIYLVIDGLESWAGSRRTYGQAVVYAIELGHDFAA